MTDPRADLRTDRDGHVAVVEIRRGPNNFFDAALIQALAETFEALDADPDARCILLCAEGKNFCAGADFGSGEGAGPDIEQARRLYRNAVRLFRAKTPVVAAVQGAAVGGGLGLALVADFRAATAQSRFTANFNRLGIHPGFGLSTTLPRLVGPQKASLLFFTGRRIGGDEALAIGLVDQLAAEDALRQDALAFAQEIALSAPLAVATTRATLRNGLADAVEAAVERELAAQAQSFRSEDFIEGVKAMTERRAPMFTGR
ncbi:MAG TPA: enoyl-CoA hydratase/isomerase family protein [Caulobacteraceae bacterium]|jgi:enoyl-CoA hydratase/carnithine racemase|nr:enoyl-CoA hydratase/isomerase family protein [Caulobacteraceae bacterium]